MYPLFVFFLFESISSNLIIWSMFVQQLQEDAEEDWKNKDTHPLLCFA